MSPLDATNALFIMGFYSFCVVALGQRHLNTVRGAITTGNHNAQLESWPIRARLASQNDALRKNRHVS